MYLPKLKRIELCASSSDKPNARRTYEGSKVAEVQAEPLDTAASLKATSLKIHLQQVEADV